jgi:phosphate transporter
MDPPVGILSLVPVVRLFGSGILTTGDFNSFNWSVLSLVGGGMVLSQTVVLSGLLHVALDRTKKVVAAISRSHLLVFVVVQCLFGSIVDSEKIAASFFPAVEIAGADAGHSAAFVVLSALALHTAKLMHVSSISNALVFSIRIDVPEDDAQRGIITGTPLLSGADFLVYAGPTVVIGVLLVATLGFGIAAIVGL